MLMFYICLLSTEDRGATRGRKADLLSGSGVKLTDKMRQVYYVHLNRTTYSCYR